MTTTNTITNETTAARIADLYLAITNPDKPEFAITDIVPDDYTPNQFNTPDGDYLVLTDEEADQAAADYIRDELWAFRADFILDQCGIFDELNHDERSAAVKSLEAMQGKLCESCNAFIAALIEGTCGLEHFIEAAIEADGRGHFLAGYDFDECATESGEYYIYRVN